MPTPSLEILARYNGHFPLCFHDHVLYSRRGSRLFEWRDLAGTPIQIEKFALTLKERALMSNRVTERLLRQGISHLAISPSGSRLLIVNKRCHFRASGSDTWRPVGCVGRGSRPMRFGVTADDEGNFYAGEYFSNPRREHVSIIKFAEDGTSMPAHTFPSGSIRHIHLIQKDPFDGRMWAATGDYGRESRIMWSQDGFETITEIGRGDQSWRATSLVFSPEALFWGMDSPSERCRIVRWDRASGNREFLDALPGPIWHATANESGWYSFSTAVEPSPVLTEPKTYLYSGRDGERFDQVASFDKDGWHLKYFQFGLVYFPTGTAPDNYIVFSGNALRGADNCMYIGRLWE